MYQLNAADRDHRIPGPLEPEHRIYPLLEMYREKYKISQINRTFHDFLADLDKEVDFISEEWKGDKINGLVEQGMIYGGSRSTSKKASAKRKR